MREEIFKRRPGCYTFSFWKEEEEILKFWKEQDIFSKVLEQNKDKTPFVFFEGPPTANGMPHPGHCLTRIIKDIILRYKTMMGYDTKRKAGWDTHGLPVEIEVSKELNLLGDKLSIEEFGVSKFNEACVNSVFKYKDEWENLTERLGFWIDKDNPYVTFEQSYVESVWWALKQLFDKDLLYQGNKIVWWWPKGGTALSAGEVSEGYKTVSDPSLTLKFPLKPISVFKIDPEGSILDIDSISFLVWTTTPWSLSSNCALAVNAEAEYSIIKLKDTSYPEYYILASDLIEKNIKDPYEIHKTMLGKDLVGLKYFPAFDYGTPYKKENPSENSDKYWVVVDDPSVDIAKGTGILHLAPAFGEDDYAICDKHGIGFLNYLNPDGTFNKFIHNDPYDDSPIVGKFCKDADKAIVRLLKTFKLVFAFGSIEHSYPFCPRAMDDPLIQYTRKSWFIKTTQYKDKMLEYNKEISWCPKHIQDGRFGDFLETNVDWALSRERYWGTPLPIWVCNKTGYMECISSYDELTSKEKVEGTHVWAGAWIDNPEINQNLRLHKPFIDHITYQSPKHPDGRMIRVPDVIDVWFDAGCMPFAQWGYPHVEGSKEQFDKNYSAEFIAEGLDQTRGWFYSLLAIHTMVHEKELEKPPFQNCIALGHILGEKGEKLSKRLKNYSSPKEIINEFGSDALRWSFILKNPPTNSIRFSKKLIKESQSDFLMHWYNVYSFFISYANIDGFNPKDYNGLNEIFETNQFECKFVTEQFRYSKPYNRKLIDRWILEELKKTTFFVHNRLYSYDVHAVAKFLDDFVSNLSNWYVRRTRSFFWQNGWDNNKADCYWTLYECLIKLAKLAAPVTPFFSEFTWKSLTSNIEGLPESIHLTTFPKYISFRNINEEILKEMELVREVVNIGLQARANEKIKVRQPLSMCEIILNKEADLDSYSNLISDELNVKFLKISVGNSERYISHYEVRPDFKKLGPRFGKDLKYIATYLEQTSGLEEVDELINGPGIEITFKGEKLFITSDEVSIKPIPRPGFSFSQSDNLILILDTIRTPKLIEEGLVRDLIRSLQDIRKELKLNYTDRINFIMNTTSQETENLFRSNYDEIAKDVLIQSFLINNSDDKTRFYLEEFKCHVDIFVI